MNNDLKTLSNAMLPMMKRAIQMSMVEYDWPTVRAVISLTRRHLSQGFGRIHRIPYDFVCLWRGNLAQIAWLIRYVGWRWSVVRVPFITTLTMQYLSRIWRNYDFPPYAGFISNIRRFDVPPRRFDIPHISSILRGLCVCISNVGIRGNWDLILLEYFCIL